MDDYYPFGLTFNSYSRENSTPNQYKFNGIEEQDELGLNVYQAFFRTMDPTIGRWWQIDPKIDDYYSWSPYNAMADNPISVMDPLGDEWADPKKDQKVADRIAKGLDKQNASLAKSNTKLDKQIANAKGKTDKVNSLTAQKNANTQAMGVNSQTKTSLGNMAKKDESDGGIHNVKYTFNVLPSTETGGETGIVNGVVTISVIAGSLGNQAHEVTHGADIGEHRVPLFGGLPNLDAAGQERFETRGYQAQVAAEPSRMPTSTFTATPQNVSQVNGPYLGGIMESDGVTPTYRKINAVYKSQYQKK